MRGGQFPGSRPCAHAGCGEEGAYRAPVHRPGSSFAAPSGPPQWQYFCLEHVRAFNSRWNYFEGMDADAIFQAHTPYPQWDRETRAFAHNAFVEGPDRVEDMLGVLRWRSAHASATAPTILTREDRQALSKLGLADDATLTDAKAAYRKLARRYHPDANGGDRSHEQRLQSITEAVDHLSGSATFRRQGGGA